MLDALPVHRRLAVPSPAPAAHAIMIAGRSAVNRESRRLFLTGHPLRNVVDTTGWL